MKKIYFYNKNTKEFAGYDVIEDTAEIPANATTVEPVDSNGVGLYDPTWNENTNSWDSLTEEEWKKKYIVPEVEPQVNSQLQASIAAKKEMLALKQSNDTLAKKVSELSKSIIAIKKEKLTD